MVEPMERKRDCLTTESENKSTYSGRTDTDYVEKDIYFSTVGNKNKSEFSKESDTGFMEKEMNCITAEKILENLITVTFVTRKNLNKPDFCYFFCSKLCKTYTKESFTMGRN